MILLIGIAVFGALCSAIDLQISEPLEPGQVLVYRFEVEDEPTSELESVDFAQHDLYVNWRDIAILGADWLRCGDPNDPNCISE